METQQQPKKRCTRLLALPTYMIPSSACLYTTLLHPFFIITIILLSIQLQLNSLIVAVLLFLQAWIWYRCGRARAEAFRWGEAKDRHSSGTAEECTDPLVRWGHLCCGFAYRAGSSGKFLSLSLSLLTFCISTPVNIQHTTRQASLAELTKRKTTLMIAHRLSTIADADIINVMKGGTIVESGNHAELLALDGIYASMWRHQQQQSNPAPSPNGNTTTSASN